MWLLSCFFLLLSVIIRREKSNLLNNQKHKVLQYMPSENVPHQRSQQPLTFYFSLSSINSCYVVKNDIIFDVWINYTVEMSRPNSAAFDQSILRFNLVRMLTCLLQYTLRHRYMAHNPPTILYPHPNSPTAVLPRYAKAPRLRYRNGPTVSSISSSPLTSCVRSLPI